MEDFNSLLVIDDQTAFLKDMHQFSVLVLWPLQFLVFLFKPPT